MFEDAVSHDMAYVQIPIPYFFRHVLLFTELFGLQLFII